MHHTASSLAELLERVLDGQASIEFVLETAASFDGELVGCLHGLQHFAADSDLRAKDTRYKLMQEGEMRRLIALLQSGANRASLEKVHFLGVSDA